MLKLAGESDVGLEKIEQLTYDPSVQTTNDLEVATKTITRTAEASGLANADYSASLTLAKPGDARLVIKRICSRESFVIDSMTAGSLNRKVYVDVQDADHLVHQSAWNATGTKLEADDFTSGTIFNLLSDGQPHTFYWFFWVDTGNAVLSLVQLWLGVGTHLTSYYECLRLNHSGLISFASNSGRVGTGSKDHAFVPVNWGIYQGTYKSVLLLYNYGDFLIKGTVDTDLNYMDKVAINLRSEQ